MSIEKDIFKRAKIDFNKLSAYGFVKKNDQWVYTQPFMNDEFKAIVVIDKQGQIFGDVFETDSEESYLPLRVDSMAVGYVGQVRSEYEKILENIKVHCAVENYFVGVQANRLVLHIIDKYGDFPVFPWEKFNRHGVFKNQDNGKWYALVMTIDWSKLNKKLSGEVEVVNIKLAEEKIPNLVTQKGFYPAYHMNKKSWITIVLDETVRDDVLFDLLAESHAFTLGKTGRNKGGHTEWLVPANPKYFDIIEAFSKNSEIIWKQSSDINVGDIAYMYVGAPYSAVLYKCEVTEADIPYHYEDTNLKICKVMKIKRLKKYDRDFMTFAKLKEYGIRAVRGPRFCPLEVSKVLS